MEPTNSQFPISHVKMVPANPRRVGKKVDSYGETDEERHTFDNNKDAVVQADNNYWIPDTIKVNTDPTKKK